MQKYAKASFSACCENCFARFQLAAFSENCSLNGTYEAKRVLLTYSCFVQGRRSSVAIGHFHKFPLSARFMQISIYKSALPH